VINSYNNNDNDNNNNNKWHNNRDDKRGEKYPMILSISILPSHTNRLGLKKIKMYKIMLLIHEKTY